MDQHLWVQKEISNIFYGTDQLSVERLLRILFILQNGPKEVNEEIILNPVVCEFVFDNASHAPIYKTKFKVSQVLDRLLEEESNLGYGTTFSCQGLNIDLNLP